MTGSSTPASGGVTTDPVRIGTMLYTLVEPHRGHEVAHNRWYERDHFYAGCQIGAYNFSGARFVATADLKELRLPKPGSMGWPSPIVPDPQLGSFLAVYYVLAGHHDEWWKWAVDQVTALQAADRMFSQRDHVHTGLYAFEWEHRRDHDGVPAELTLDRRFPGVVSVIVEAAPGVEPTEVSGWYRHEYLPSVLPGSAVATVLAFSPIPMVTGAPGGVPDDDGVGRRLLLQWFLDDAPARVWGGVFTDQGDALAARGLGRMLWASPFVGTVPGTDTYTDQLWSTGP